MAIQRYTKEELHWLKFNTAKWTPDEWTILSRYEWHLHNNKPMPNNFIIPAHLLERRARRAIALEQVAIDANSPARFRPLTDGGFATTNPTLQATSACVPTTYKTTPTEAPNALQSIVEPQLTTAQKIKQTKERNAAARAAANA